MRARSCSFLSGAALARRSSLEKFRLGDRRSRHQISIASDRLDYAVASTRFGGHLGVHEVQNCVHSSEMIEKGENSESCEVLDSM